MHKPWLQEYPDNVPENIELQYGSLIEMLEDSFQQHAQKDAYESFDKRLTYTDIEVRSRAFAAWLQASGFKPGDRVAIMMPNLLQYPVALFGILRAGLVAVNTNPLYTARELKHQLTDAGCKAIVVVKNFAHVVAEVQADTQVEHVITTGVGDLLGLKGHLVNFVLKHVKKQIPAYSVDNEISFNDVLSSGSKLNYESASRDLDDIAFLQYTGGTTGVAKGAMLTHSNMLSNIAQSGSWLSSIGDQGVQDTIITAIPLYHVFALQANCLLYFKRGALNRLIANPRDMKGFVKELSKPYTAITGVNTLFNGLLNTEGFADLDFSQVKYTLGGGMAVQRAVAERWKEVTGKTILVGYGLTETSPAACISPPKTEDFEGTIGVPIPSTEASVQDTEGNILSVGEVGELCIRGPQVMKGYWQRPEDTAEVITEDGWLRTGDMATMDERGHFSIVDRKKDMILVSGFNVYPNEIEDVLAMHPGVLEVGVIGVPDEKSGELVKAVVVKKEASLEADELRTYAKKELTGYKVPKHIQFVDELPKTNVGKILRKDLRDLYGKA